MRAQRGVAVGHTFLYTCARVGDRSSTERAAPTAEMDEKIFGLIKKWGLRRPWF